MDSDYFRPFGLLRRIVFAAASFFVVVYVCALPPAAAHEGHDHDDAASKLLVTTIYPRVTAQSEQYQIVGVLKSNRLSIYLDHLASNEPIRNADLSVTIGDGEAVTATSSETGTYALVSPRLTKPGSVEIIFSLRTPTGDDLLVGALAIPDPAAAGRAAPERRTGWVAAVPGPVRSPVFFGLVLLGLGVLMGHFYRAAQRTPAVATGTAAVAVLAVLIGFSGGNTAPTPAAPAVAMSDAPRRLPDGSAFVAKPTQRLLEVRTAPAVPESDLRPAVNLIGRVIGDPNRTSVVQSLHGGRVAPLATGLPRIGQPVKKGDILAEIDPYLPLADRTTISEKAGEINQLIAIAEAKIRRLRPLAEREVVPRSQIADAETELDGLRQRRETIRNTRTDRELLKAPTDGVISTSKVVPGQVVQAQDILFEIVDPKSLWVEALAYGEVDPASLGDATAAGTDGQIMPLAFEGYSRTLQQQASVVQFAIREPPANLRVGQPVTVSAGSGKPRSGLVVPRDAVVRNASGEVIVWLHIEPERFEPRPVRTEPLDASRVMVAAGVTDGERVVVRSADLVNQVR